MKKEQVQQTQIRHKIMQMKNEKQARLHFTF